MNQVWIRRALTAACVCFVTGCADDDAAPAGDTADAADAASDGATQDADAAIDDVDGADGGDVSDADAGVDADAADTWDVPDASVRPRNETCHAPERPPPAGPVVLTEVFTAPLQAADLRELVALAYDPADPTRWYAATRQGEVWTFREGDTDAQLALDISERLFLGHRETGIMSMALDPVTSHLWLVYGAPHEEVAHEGLVARYDLGDDGTADPDSEVIFLRELNGANWHNNDHIAFGPDGYLYHSAGDGGAAAWGLSQDLRRFAGKIVRIDVHTPDDERGLPYSIPPDNPFADGVDGAPEVWAWGLRNPWRFGIDPETGVVWAGDVGQDTWEEINRIAGPGNYGWPHMEGYDCYVTSPDCDPADYEVPWSVYAHSDGISISMGGAYRGDAMPELDGAVVYGDFGNGALWLSREVDGEVINERVLETGLNIVGFAIDPAGEMLVIDYGAGSAARVFRIEPAPEVAEDSFPRVLSETGCVDMNDPASPLPGMFAYEPIAPLWSDGSDKSRLLAIPDDRRIELGDDGDLLFPVGSVLVKHFGYDGVLHETRLLIRHDDGWAGYSYRWRDDGSDADLLEGGLSVDLTSGVSWVYPSRSQCMECHTDASDRTLGLEVAGLDWDHDGAGTTQLERLAATEYLSPTAVDALPALAGQVPRHVDPYGDAPLADRARSWLHANCSSCHRPDAPVARGNVDLRFATPFAEMGACDVAPEAGGLGIDDARVIAPGDPERSVLFYRLSHRNHRAMPPLGTRIIDPDATEAVRAWIEGLASCDAP